MQNKVIIVTGVSKSFRNQVLCVRKKETYIILLSSIILIYVKKSITVNCTLMRYFLKPFFAFTFVYDVQVCLFIQKSIKIMSLCLSSQEH